MLYIGFSNYSHKIHAKIFCHKFKHCAPVVITDNIVTIYQFVRINKTVKIIVNKNDLQILRKHGWIFIKYKDATAILFNSHCLTCVQFTKMVCGIKNIKIQTPLALFKYLNK